MDSASEHWVDWCAHSGSRDCGGSMTHAVDARGSMERAICGVPVGGDGCVFTVVEIGGVACMRCTKILTKRGILT